MTAENVSTSRKPHSGNAGFVCELKCKLGGHIVVYDRKAGFQAAADTRWIVAHEPSGQHVAVKTESHAREVMKGVAKASTIEEACRHADILPRQDEDPTNDNPVKDWLEVPASERDQALERFLADPENEPSAEGKAALRVAFDLDKRRRS